MNRPQSSPDPDVLIPNKTYFKIGEVVRITGLEAHVLRYWETEFQHISPEKSRSGQRLYRREHIERILEVKELLYRQKFTIAGARRRLLHRYDRDAAEIEADELRSSMRDKIQQRERDLQDTLTEIRSDLLEIRRRVNLG